MYNYLIIFCFTLFYTSVFYPRKFDRRPEIFHILNIFIHRKDRVRFVFASVLLFVIRQVAPRQNASKLAFALGLHYLCA